MVVFYFQIYISHLLKNGKAMSAYDYAHTCIFIALEPLSIEKELLRSIFQYHF